jgi:hypothetical protein
LVIGVIAAALALLLTGGGSAKADTVRFQNAGRVGPDPFTAPTDVASQGEDGSTPDGQDGTDTTTPDGQDGTETPSGGQDGESTQQPGTFGGTGSNTVCDREKLIKALSADPDKLREWAEVVGVEPTEESVSSYIRELRPVELTQDTQVTNHSYTGGSAKSYQAIMQKGTAVLVDKDGKPVTRCRCGNPLAEPVELEEETKCYDCPPNYQPPPPCDYYDYPDDKYKQYDDQDFEKQVKPDEYKGTCYKPEPEPPPVKKDGEPPDEEPTPKECSEDPTTPGCEQQCTEDPSLPYCDGQTSEEACAEDPSLPQCDDTPTPDGQEPPPDGEEPPSDGGEPPPDGGGEQPSDGGTSPPDGEQPPP